MIIEDPLLTPLTPVEMLIAIALFCIIMAGIRVMCSIILNGKSNKKK